SPFSHVTILTAHRHGHCISFATHTATPNIYPLSLHDALPISVTQRVDPLDPVAADLGAEEIPLEVEGGGREVGVLEPRAGLEDADAVALLGQPERGDGPAEPRTDDQDIEVSTPGLAQGRPTFFISLRLALKILANASSESPSTGANRSSRWVATDCDSV